MQQRPAILVRHVSPGGRVLVGVLCTAGIATAPVHSSPPLIVAATLSLLLILVCRPPLRVHARRMLFGALAAFALVAPLLLAGDARRALLLGSRALLSLTVALSIASTLTFVEVPGALAALGLPGGLVRVLSAMLSQFALLRDTARRLLLARALRGAPRFSVGPDVLAALLVYSAARAERVELALSLRGFDPSGIAERGQLRKTDAIPLVLAALAAVCVHVISVAQL